MKTLRYNLRMLAMAILLLSLEGEVSLFAETKPEPKKSPQNDEPNSPSNTVVEGSYAALLKPLDIFAPPPNAKKLLSLPELYLRVQTKGVALKVSRETLNAARENLKSDRDKKIPVLSLDLGHNQGWSKSMTDSDPSDLVNDRKGLSQSHSLGSSAGLSLSGAPVQGVTYKLAYPELVSSKKSSDSATETAADTAALNASVSVALLKDNPLSVESITRKKNTLTMVAARENFRLETLQKLNAAEASYYGLVQKYLQLSVQERSHLLARVLERDVKEKIAVGEASSLEATSAELQTAQSEIELMTSQIDYEAAVAEFRSGLAFEESDGQGVFPDPKTLDIDVESLRLPKNALADVRKSNPEISTVRIAKQIADLDYDLSKNATLPSLALSVSYGNSTSGDGWGATSQQALKPQDRLFKVGLTYSHILFNDTQVNVKRQAAVSRQKAEFAADETEAKLEKQYSSLIKKIEIGSKRYRIAKVSREIAEKKLNSEYERFRAGESNVRNVIDTQTEVNAARISEIGARVELLLGHSELRTLLGKLPEGITLAYGG